MAKKKKERSKVLPESVSDALGAGTGDTPFGTAPGSNGVYEDRRIRTCADARAIFVQLQQENQLRAQAYAQVRNQMEGGRPFDPATLARNGEQARTNCNFNDARAQFCRAAEPYWKMVHEVPHVISPTIYSDSPQAPEWQIALAENFDRFLKDWNREGTDYFFQFSGASADMILQGPGFIMWPDGTSPRYQWMQTVQLLLPRRTKSAVNKWELAVFKTDMTASELIEKVRDGAEQKKSKKAGWNPDAIMLAVQRASPQPYQTRFLDPNYFQDMIVSNDLTWGNIWPPVQIVHEWARQRDGTIKHYIFTEKGDVADYLYEGTEDADGFHRIFGSLMYSIGSNGLIHAVKGFGVMNYYYMTAINRLKCKSLDAVSMSMSLNFTKEENAPDQSPAVESYSFVNIFPRGLAQIEVYPNLQQSRQMMQDLVTAQNENNYAYTNTGTQQNIAEAQTKGQGELIAGIAAEMDSSRAAIYLSQQAVIYTEIFRRLCLQRGDPDAKKFRERCLKAGVPRQILNSPGDIDIEMAASPSMASPLMRKRVADELTATVAPQPEANRRAILEFRVASLTGARGVRQFLLPQGSASAPFQRREAMMENPDLAQGIPLPAAPEDAHVEHLDEHLKPLEMMIQATKQGQPLTPDHLIAMQMTLTHAQQHMQFLEQDETKQAEFKQLNARFSLVARMAQGIQQRMARAQTNGHSPDQIRQAMIQPRQ